MLRATFKFGEMKLSFQGENEELSTRLVREKITNVMNVPQEKTVMQLMEGEKGIVLEGIKAGNGEFRFSSTGIQVEEQKESIADFGLEWLDKLVDEPEENLEGMDEEDDMVEEEDATDPVQTLKEMFDLSEFVDLIKTFLDGNITA